MSDTTSPKKRVLFIDRDGTIIVEPPTDYQVDSLEKLAFVPKAIRNLYEIRSQLDFEWAMVTNQDGLGTDAFPEDTFWPPHNLMLDILKGEGIEFDKQFIDRTFKKDNQPTRKPGTALLTEYFSEEYDLANSFVIGDRLSDMQLAKNLGAKGIMIGKSLDLQDDDVDLEALRETIVLTTEDWDEITALLKGSKGRSASIRRTTKETDIQIALDLDGKGRNDNQTGVGFFDHMLDQLGKHGRMDLQVKVEGDLHIDPHHTIEDTALALGSAFLEALGDKRGIERYGFFNLVMDEALAEVALDFSGRPWLVFEADFNREKVGDFPVEMLEHFFKSFSDNARCNLSIKLSGKNAHHMIEAAFKGFARAIRAAITRIPGDDSLPSTKGVL
ncbi:bifunctional histidinol-phosphatase/imidazoleglycerol-phosphate dehydratase HisB [Pontibacter sp. G13]|uniref:bifunctional histidinol-phosphatase/imidazoleglycerol-phosphate dehydratase HisB n=1 Tax=Pontibacter sp. G13 TaxID=3074898 RepID=UPI00288968B0|nr:bifunctional histidinol-phosphatase/imidazoleglycerol-phosphate dehydratase HisB [Pontibacter sp. G13]WNJ18725.1 bifunctional histidinol-phosphatase/imidazoleglycerol-phosphate dehydratase HisB [Pontibacter sp. G13]